MEDLVNHRYDGKGSELRGDLRSLLAQGLVERRTAFVAQGRHRLAVLVLTKAGRKVAEAKRAFGVSWPVSSDRDISARHRDL